MLKRSIALLAALVLFGVTTAEAATVGTLTGSQNRRKVAEITANGDTEDFTLYGLYSVRCAGNFDSANIDLETEFFGAWVDVAAAALVDMVADIDYTGFEAGSGRYRLEVESAGGSTDVDCDFRRVRR